MSAPFTLEQLQAVFGGALVGPRPDFGGEPDRVVTTIEIGRSLAPSTQLILDAAEPHGFQVRCVTAHAQRACEAVVYAQLGLPPRPANDNEPLPRGPFQLPMIDPRDWQGVPVREREWFVPPCIPAGTVTLFSGDGGTGKSQLALQLIASSALSVPWLGMPVAAGPCLYYGAEDSADELHRRFACILEHHGRTFAELTGVRLVTMAERDAVLASPDKFGTIQPTPTFVQLSAEARALKPKLIVIDTSADAFGGDEIKRVQVRQFITSLRALASELGAAVLLLSHPSLTGMQSGSGLSGSTAWSNSVRSRLYLTAATDSNDRLDPLARILSVKKSNYGPAGTDIPVRWQDGVYVLDDGPDPVSARLINGKADQLFLDLLDLFNSQGQNLTASTGTSYAPAKMAKHPKAKGYNKKELGAAMQRLLDVERIKIEVTGSDSRRRSRLVVVEVADVAA